MIETYNTTFKPKIFKCFLAIFTMDVVDITAKWPFRFHKNVSLFTIYLYIWLVLVALPTVTDIPTNLTPGVSFIVKVKYIPLPFGQDNFHFPP